VTARLAPLFEECRAEHRAALIGYLPAGYPTVDGSRALLCAMLDAAAGGLGVITPDLIPDEAQAWLAVAQAHALDRIFLVAPSSTDQRLADTATVTRGFLYASSVMGVTGARDVVSSAAPKLVRRVRECAPKLPVCVGLGVRNGAQAAEVAAFADGVVVGSAFVTAAGDSEASVRALATDLATGVRRPATQPA
jgi:tryptophan synthase alpha chain